MTTATHMDSKLLDEWIAETARRQWAFVYWPNRERPEVLAAYRRWKGLGVTDVIALINEDFAFGYRALVPDEGDFLAPDWTLYALEAEPIHVIRALITLPEPTESSAPDVPSEAPPGIKPLFAKLGYNRAIRPVGSSSPLPVFRLRAAATKHALPDPRPEPSNEGSP